MKNYPPLRYPDSVEALGRVKASLATLAAGAALTQPSHYQRRLNIEAAGDLEEGRTPMTLTPSITVTVGHQTRIYFAFVTTAPIELDSPATVTLHTATFADLVNLALEPITFDRNRGQTQA